MEQWHIKVDLPFSGDGEELWVLRYASVPRYTSVHCVRGMEICTHLDEAPDRTIICELFSKLLLCLFQSLAAGDHLFLGGPTDGEGFDWKRKISSWLWLWSY